MLIPPRMLAHVLLAGACVLAAGFALGACTQPINVHDTQEAKGQPCINCHNSAYMTTTNPKHAGVMPTNCNTCHNTGSWLPATVTDHHWFPLDGKHTTVACGNCHVNGYNPGATPTDCYSCHMADFQNASNNIAGHANFATTCQDCHTTAGWDQAGGHPESKFPITTGKHANSGISCTDCHSQPGPWTAGQNTDCIHCHLGAHTTPGIDSTHQGISGYPAGGSASAPTPNFCLMCHPSGQQATGG